MLARADTTFYAAEAAGRNRLGLAKKTQGRRGATFAMSSGLRTVLNIHILRHETLAQFVTFSYFLEHFLYATQ